MLRDGDLVKVRSGYHRWGENRRPSCNCFFCFHNSKEVGIVTTIWIDEDDSQSAIIEFDVGEWVFRKHEFKHLDVVSSL
jgi:hypothetical protein